MESVSDSHDHEPSSRPSQTSDVNMFSRKKVHVAFKLFSNMSSKLSVLATTPLPLVKNRCSRQL